MNLWPRANRAFYESRVWTTLTDDEGRRICKYPTDLWAYEEVIRRIRPEVIVETGSFEGGSASWFSRFAEVISIDIHSPFSPIPGVRWFQGRSIDMASEVTDVVAGRRCLVSLDSDHSAPYVLEELRAYSPMADYMVVEDTAVDAYDLDHGDYPEGGPGIAVEQFLSSFQGWEPDPGPERFLLGMNPGGWLRRVA